MPLDLFLQLLGAQGFVDISGCITKNSIPLADWYYKTNDASVVDSVRVIDTNQDETNELKLLLLIHNIPVHLLPEDDEESIDLFEYFHKQIGDDND